MARFYGKVGYGFTEEIRPGVWEVVIKERPYYGDEVRNIRRYERGEGVNDNLKIQNEISILADAYAYDHFHAIRYVEWFGAKWEVTSVEVQRPRLVLSLGGVYND